MDKHGEIMRALGSRPFPESAPLPLPHSVVASLEETIGDSLPEDYRHFFINYSGAILLKDVCGPTITNPFGDHEFAVTVFLGIVGNEANNILEVKRSMADRIPDNFLPIANDGGTNLIGIITSGPLCGAVGYWDSLFEREKGPHDFEAETPHSDVFMLASSFDNFLESLETVEEYELSINTKLSIDELVQAMPSGKLTIYNGCLGESREFRIWFKRMDEHHLAKFEKDFAAKYRVVVELYLRVGGKADVSKHIELMTDTIASILNSDSGDAVIRNASKDIIFERVGSRLRKSPLRDVADNSKLIGERVIAKLQLAENRWEM